MIVTGGDPLILAPRRISEVTRAIGAISHVKIIRWHTRVPVVAPERVTPELIGGLTATSGKAVYVAIHANHPRELNSAARAAIAALRSAGLVLISQTVLLKGINDDVAALAELMRALLASGVKPYYLHHGDLAPGTGHFRTTIEEGRELMRALRGRLTGIAMPAYVLDIPGGFGKVPIDDDHVGPVDTRTGARTVIDPRGKPHIYRDRLNPSRVNSNGS